MLVATLFEEGGRCVATMPALMLQPFQTLLSMAVLCCFLGVGSACLNTAGKLVADDQGRVTFQVPVFFRVTGWLLLFGCLWISQFLLGCQNMIVSGAVAHWYFTRVKTELARPVWRSLCTLFRHHLGSVAFGSLLLAILKALKTIIKVAGKSCESKCMFKSISLFLHAVFHYVKFFTKNVYVIIALYGESFCPSARLSYALLSANGHRVAAAEGVCALFLCMVNVLAATVAASFGYLLFKSLDVVWIPVGMVLLLSFFCCRCLTSVYDIVIDVLLLCFCVDCRDNDAVTRPYYMTKNLEILLADTGSDPV